MGYDHRRTLPGASVVMERRRHPRRKVPYLPLRSPVAGTVLDLSVEGMKVEVSEALAVGSKREFVIGETGSRARIRGLVRWCRLSEAHSRGPEGQSRVYLAGVVFLGIDDELPGDLVG